MGSGASQWYLIAHARHGDVSIRVRSEGMVLGESAAGDLSFQQCRAQMQLAVTDDNRVALNAFPGHGLSTERESYASRECLVVDRPTEIRLPKNVVYLVTDFLYPQRAEEIVEVRESRVAPPDTAIIEAPAPVPAAPDPSPVVTLPPPPTAEFETAAPAIEPYSDARAPRARKISGVAVIALIGLIVVAPALFSPTTDDPDPTTDNRSPDAAAPSSGPAHELEDAAPVVSVPPVPLIEADETLVATVIRAPTTPPSTANDAPIVPAGEVPIVVAEAEVRSRDDANVAKARTAEFALYALSSADLALADGRLTKPPGRNAYALYKRVLALDPQSQEAKRGLQAVRQELINRALAQLASGELNGARALLQSAADAGADPKLIANLRNEVEQRYQVPRPTREAS